MSKETELSELKRELAESCISLMRELMMICVESPEFRRKLAQSYSKCLRELILDCIIDYMGYEIDMDSPCFQEIKEWIIIKNDEDVKFREKIEGSPYDLSCCTGEYWEKVSPYVFIRSIPDKLIYDTLDSDSISVFDVLMCVGFNDGLGNALSAIIQSMNTFSQELLKGTLFPRNPATKQQWTADTVDFIKPDSPVVYPDLSWILSFEEAEEWCVKSFATSLKALRERIGDKLNNPEHSEKPNKAEYTADKPEPTIEPMTEDKPELPAEPTTKAPVSMSLELEAANRAHQVLYVDGLINPSKPDKPQIEKWLSKNYSEKQLSKTAKKRIAIVINLNKNGGVKPM